MADAKNTFNREQRYLVLKSAVMRKSFKRISLLCTAAFICANAFVQAGAWKMENSSGSDQVGGSGQKYSAVSAESQMSFDVYTDGRIYEHSEDFYNANPQIFELHYGVNLPSCPMKGKVLKEYSGEGCDQFKGRIVNLGGFPIDVDVVDEVRQQQKVTGSIYNENFKKVVLRDKSNSILTSFTCGGKSGSRSSHYVVFHYWKIAICSSN